MKANILNNYINSLHFPFYSTIVIGSILLGVILACIIMYREGLKRTSIIYTAFLTFVCIMVCGLSLQIWLTGDPKRLAFTGAGGALGLLIGAFSSIFIHRDHEKEMMASWVVTAPLMYGLAKTACHISGCCVGIPYHGKWAVVYESDHISRFPVQLSESLLFTLIFLIGLFMLLISGKPLLTSRVVIVISVIAKFSMDYLREGHYITKSPLSQNQILALICGVIALGLVEIMNNILGKKQVKGESKIYHE